MPFGTRYYAAPACTFLILLLISDIAKSQSLPATADFMASGRGLRLWQAPGSCGKSEELAPVLRRIPFVDASCEVRPLAESEGDSCGRANGMVTACKRQDDRI
jgi:hypothetical protein